MTYSTISSLLIIKTESCKHTHVSRLSNVVRILLNSCLQSLGITLLGQMITRCKNILILLGLRSFFQLEKWSIVYVKWSKREGGWEISSWWFDCSIPMYALYLTLLRMSILFQLLKERHVIFTTSLPAEVSGPGKLSWAGQIPGNRFMTCFLHPIT